MSHSHNTKKPKAKPIPLDPTKIIECPICLDVITPPITQCEVGHSMCRTCFDGAQRNTCVICQGPMTRKRHVAFEQLVESVRQNLESICRYSYKGCTFKVTPENRNSHEVDCRHRTYKCEGKIYAGWKCDWIGDYAKLEEHFKQTHKNQTNMQYTTNASIKINFNANFKDIQLISFFNGQAFFYCKHCVDVQKQKIYWAFQYLGLKSNAQHYFCEFEIHQGPIRKFKVTEICQNDTTKIEDIFESEKCVVVSFAAAQSFLNEDNELPFKFRIMKYKPPHK